MKARAAILVSAGVTAVVAIAGYFAVRGCLPGRGGVSARFDAPSGETFLVIQEWNSVAEPYSVSLFVRQYDGKWGWCYIDHDSHWLQNVTIRPSSDGRTIGVYSREQVLGKYDILDSTFSLTDENGRIQRTLAAPQEWRPPPAQYLP
jgi:hypothetical protein